VEVGTALAQRRYAAPVDVVIEVTDEFCPWNTGRWRLTVPPVSTPPATGQAAGAAQAGAAGAARPVAGLAATCERTSAPAEVALPAHALGAAYLGGTRLAPLAAAGLITELRPGALAALSAAMSWDPAPWCPLIF
jgi:Sterol carrier protein domain